MGNTLTLSMIRAFQQEVLDIEKRAGPAGDFFKSVLGKLRSPRIAASVGSLQKKIAPSYQRGSWPEQGKMVAERLDPMRLPKNLSEGWLAMTPGKSPARQIDLMAEHMGPGSRSAFDKARAAMIEQHPHAPIPIQQELALAKQHFNPSDIHKPEGVLGRLSETLGSTRHLIDPSRGYGEIAKSKATIGQKAQAFAEEASRRGWTGEGRLTKYLPLGQKGMMATFTGVPLADAVNAPADVGQTGEGGRWEKGLQAAANPLLWTLGAPLGLAGNLGAFLGGSYLAGKAGRYVDRRSSGASAGTAATAPTPQEAAEQLQNIMQYYNIER